MFLCQFCCGLGSFWSLVWLREAVPSIICGFDHNKRLNGDMWSNLCKW